MMTDQDNAARVASHRTLLHKRGRPLSWEEMPAEGQAAEWFHEVRRYVTLSGQDVARQLARLCGQDSEVTVPWRSLADAVGRRDRAGRTVAYTQSGVDVLMRHGWLEVETTGQRRGARTTFRLLPGDPYELPAWLAWVDERDALDLAA